METLRPGDALLLVDVQNDFCPGGALPIERGDRVVPVLNRWIRAATGLGVPVYASRDWHPAHHPSFREEGGQWPVHCVQGTSGAAFHPELELPDGAVSFVKGTRFDRDQYSAFDGTGLAARLERDGVRRVLVGGLALDYCVLHTVLEALEAGFEARLLVEGTRPVSEEGGRRALRQMQAAGASLELAS